MSIQRYGHYIIEGFGKPVGGGKFAALGRVRLGDFTVEESDELGHFEQFADAQSRGLSWAQRRADEMSAGH
ncbi:hypothetical protein BKK81_06245 [Cupriavidus sp. USMAHM13]|uniref:Uncharacterized protein n=1 Tax=Cupriavidus malaysiensis TaxID=367825 RepID=A0ABN4TIX4_9BURK|nr:MULTISPECIES: hypothetical protein [Cupriavidus]AOY98907.1 hypothetical protein BKK81_06245 [Cupriavidus sp. USMAHM13]AOZ05333.1 hypothetical protein BKK80_05550 [Cupriavidus malaysiensis]